MNLAQRAFDPRLLAACGAHVRVRAGPGTWFLVSRFVLGSLIDEAAVRRLVVFQVVGVDGEVDELFECAGAEVGAFDADRSLLANCTGVWSTDTLATRCKRRSLRGCIMNVIWMNAWLNQSSRSFWGRIVLRSRALKFASRSGLLSSLRRVAFRVWMRIDWTPNLDSSKRLTPEQLSVIPSTRCPCSYPDPGQA